MDYFKNDLYEVETLKIAGSDYNISDLINYSANDSTATVVQDTAAFNSEAALSSPVYTPYDQRDVLNITSILARGE